MKQRVLWVLVALALLTGGCNAVFNRTGITTLLPAFSAAASSGPQSSPGPARLAQAQLVASAQPGAPATTVYMLAQSSSRFPAQLTPPAAAQAVSVAQTTTQSPAAINQAPGRLQITAGQPVELTSSHSSRNFLASINVTVNGQPVGSGPTDFPTSYLDAQICAVTWQKIAQNNYAKFCPSAAARPGSLDLTLRRTYHENFTLIITGYQPGTYQLKITTTDAAGATSEIEQTIEVIGTRS